MIQKVSYFKHFFVVVLFTLSSITSVQASKTNRNSYALCKEDRCGFVDAQGKPLSEFLSNRAFYDETNDIYLYEYPLKESDENKIQRGFNAMIDGKTGKPVLFYDKPYIQGSIYVQTSLLLYRSYTAYGLSELERLQVEFGSSYKRVPRGLVTFRSSQGMRGVLCPRKDGQWYQCISPLFDSIELISDERIAASLRNGETGDSLTFLFDREGNFISQGYKGIFPIPGSGKMFLVEEMQENERQYKVIDANNQVISTKIQKGSFGSSNIDSWVIPIWLNGEYTKEYLLPNLEEWDYKKNSFSHIFRTRKYGGHITNPPLSLIRCSVIKEKRVLEGVIDFFGRVLLPCEYDKVLIFKDAFLTKNSEGIDRFSFSMSDGGKNVKVEHAQHWDLKSPLVQVMGAERLIDYRESNVWASYIDKKTIIISEDGSLTTLPDHLSLYEYLPDGSQIKGGIVSVENRSTNYRGLFNVKTGKMVSEKFIEVNYRQGRGFTRASLGRLEGGFGARYGLLDRNGQPVFDEPDLNIDDYLGKGVWVYHRISDKKSYGLKRGLLSVQEGKEGPLINFLSEPRFDFGDSDSAETYYSFSEDLMSGQPVVLREGGEDKLFDSKLQEMVSFSKAFPKAFQESTIGGFLPSGFTGHWSLIDPCYDTNEAFLFKADYLERLPKEWRLLCASSSLRQLNGMANIQFYRYQIYNSQPEVGVKRYQQFVVASRQCKTDTCLENEINSLTKWIDEQRNTLQKSEPTRLDSQMGEKEVKNLLTKPLSHGEIVAVEKHLGLKLGRPNPNDDGDGFSYSAFRIDLTGTNQSDILVEEYTGAHNSQFWIVHLNRQPKAKRWRATTILNGYSGYLGGVSVQKGSKKGEYAPISTQEHVSCCEHAITYYKFVPDLKSPPGQYEVDLSCSQYYLDKPIVSTEPNQDIKNSEGDSEALLDCRLSKDNRSETYLSYPPKNRQSLK
jgi:hypothetical protein